MESKNEAMQGVQYECSLNLDLSKALPLSLFLSLSIAISEIFSSIATTL